MSKSLESAKNYALETDDAVITSYSFSDNENQQIEHGTFQSHSTVHSTGPSQSDARSQRGNSIVTDQSPSVSSKKRMASAASSKNKKFKSSNVVREAHEPMDVDPHVNDAKVNMQSVLGRKNVKLVKIVTLEDAS
jgi:hypothetical protein